MLRPQGFLDGPDDAGGEDALVRDDHGLRDAQLLRLRARAGEIPLAELNPGRKLEGKRSNSHM